MSIQRYSFGAGKVIATPTNTSAVTPIRLFDVVEASMQIKAKSASANGGMLYAVAKGRVSEECTGKIKFLRNDPRIAAYLFHGVDVITGQNALSDLEPAVCDTLVTVANSNGYLYDGGVVNALNGTAFTRITQGTPQAGQYSCNTNGQYVFSAADKAANVAVLISYTYTIANSGFSYTVTNQEQGMAPYFRLVLEKAFNGPSGLVRDGRIIYAAQATGITEGGKSGEFDTVEIDWEAVPDALGNVQKRSVNGLAL